MTSRRARAEACCSVPKSEWLRQVARTGTTRGVGDRRSNRFGISRAARPLVLEHLPHLDTEGPSEAKCQEQVPFGGGGRTSSGSFPVAGLTVMMEPRIAGQTVQGVGDESKS
jgi:hypothetical protein